jgi:hypothetical protein
MALAPTESYRLEKSCWTEADFETMCWHDAAVHAFAFDRERGELLLDIDYILAWVDPSSPTQPFSFWLAPSTLIFRDVGEMKMQYETQNGFQLQGICRSEPRVCIYPPPRGVEVKRRWTLEENGGGISFWAAGYSQFARQLPKHHSRQSFSLSERGGISFERVENPR